MTDTTEHDHSDTQHPREALLRAITNLAPKAKAEDIKDLAEAYALVTGQD